MQRLRIIFAKTEGARFLSHLDLMATLEYSLRRAALPLALSQGFNPRPRVSSAAPLPLGYTAEREILEIVLHQQLPPDEVRARLQASVPSGITISSVHELPPGTKPAAARLRSATYRVALPQPVPDLGSRATSLLQQETLEVEEEREGKKRRRDLRPHILWLDASASGDALRMEVRIHPTGTVRPEQVVELMGIDTDGLKIVRERIDLVD